MDGNVCSVAAKLWLMTWPSLCRSTYSSAVTICGNPVVPSFSEVGVSTSTMLAPGAIDVRPLDVQRGLLRPADPVAVAGVERRHLSRPAGSPGMTAARGSLKYASKCARSLAIVGEPNESTITMVWPAPVMPGRVSGAEVVGGR